MRPVPAGIRAVPAWCASCSRGFTPGVLPPARSILTRASGQAQALGQRTAIDERTHVAGPTRSDEDVTLPDARLLREHPGVEERLADLLGQAAVVAGEAAR